MPQKIIKTAYLGRYQSQTENALNNTEIVVDAAKFTPIDLLATAYNSCMLGTMEYAAKQNGFEIQGAKSQIEWDLSEDTTRVGAMDIQISFEQDFSAEQKEIFETSAKTKCHVGQSLNPNIEKKFTFSYNAE